MSDSQKNNRSPEGPPDLDEVFRQYWAKFMSVLGGDNNGGAKGGVLLVIIVLGFLWLGSGFYSVDAAERGVVLRFGKFQAITSAGLNWHLPYPFETVEVVKVTQVRSIQVGFSGDTKVPEEALMVTEDQNIIDLQMEVQYNVSDPKDFVFNNVWTGDDPSDVVKQVSEAAIREVVGRNQVDRVLNDGREKIAVDVSANIQALLDRYKSGIHITQVNIRNVQPPEPVQTAFSDVVKARQNKEQQKNDGLAYFNNVVPTANGEAARMLAEANGYKQRVIATARGDASRFSQVLAEYQKAPGVTRQRMYVDTMQQILSNSTKVLVDQKAGNNMLYLPLDKLIPQHQSEQPKPTVPAPVEPIVKENKPTDKVGRDTYEGRVGR